MRVARVYALFIMVVLVQATVVAVAPSRGPGELASAAGPALGSSSFGQPSGGVAGTASGTSSDPANGAASSPSSSTGSAAEGTTAATAPSGAAIATASGGDTSHCVDGRQVDPALVYHSPPCMPKWTGNDNGGSTYPGVTAEAIKVIVVITPGGGTNNAIGNSVGLGYRDEEHELEVWRTYFEFVNEHYELYGRRLEVEFYENSCGETDVACLKEMAKTLATKQPFMVFGQLEVPEFYEEFARNRIMSWGLHNAPVDYYAAPGRRPFRWDHWLSGNDGAAFVAEYYCKKMAGRNASNTGSVIHPTIGARGEVARKIALLQVDTPFALEVARLARTAIEHCSGEPVEIFTVAPDVTRGQDEAAAVVSAMIQQKITTIVPLATGAPIFTSQVATQQRYFPEWVLSGLGVLDYDTLGKLMDQQQWAHAFGLGMLGARGDYKAADSSRVLTAMGRGDLVCNQCQAPWAQVNPLGWMVQVAGPLLNPDSVEQGMFAVEWPRGGAPSVDHNAWRIGPGDYNLQSDVRELYWDPNKVSEIDGIRGSYVGVNGSKRYELGQLTTAFEVPPALQ